MMQAVKCPNCGKELHWKYGEIAAHIRLAVVRPPCQACHRGRDDFKELSFCGLACLREFAAGFKLDGVAERLET